MELRPRCSGTPRAPSSSGLTVRYTVGTGATAVTYTVPDNIKSTVDFVLVGNELNPNGGFLVLIHHHRLRAPALDLPSLGIPFYEATPADARRLSHDHHTLEYDGFADFPRYR